uniref:Uncharacterized protein n=1 Tax=Cupriavidus taiwanensis TaxID=164546 RepID=A0A375HCC6_9BURK|nr:conserved protein of unknown function [Cupriavidus taiwanensis]
MDIETPFETNAQLAKGSKPGMRALHNPAMFAQAVVPLDAAACDSWLDAPLTQMLTTPSEVISLVGMEFVRTASRSTGQTWHRWYCIDQGFEDNRVVPISARYGQRQGNAAPIYDEMAFAAEFSAIRGVRAGLLAPRGLATAAPSMLARLQSIWSCSRKRVSRARCSPSQTPLVCQSRSRRQQVMPLPKPSSWGKSSHGIPVCNTNRMPPSAARSSTRGRPPLGEGSTVGSNGCKAFHNSLLIFFRAMAHHNAQLPCGDDMVLLAALRAWNRPWPRCSRTPPCRPASCI